MTGWIWRKTRDPHLVLLSSTAFSWFILGIWYGFGYCPCTDWHWQVREILGYSDPPASYIQFLLHKLTPIRLPNDTVDTVVVICLLVPAVMSVTLLTRRIIIRIRNNRPSRELSSQQRRFLIEYARFSQWSLLDHERAYVYNLARVVKLADTLDLGSSALWRKGSSPFSRTTDLLENSRIAAVAIARE